MTTTREKLELERDAQVIALRWMEAAHAERWARIVAARDRVALLNAEIEKEYIAESGGES